MTNVCASSTPHVTRHNPKARKYTNKLSHPEAKSLQDPDCGVVNMNRYHIESHPNTNTKESATESRVGLQLRAHSAEHSTAKPDTTRERERERAREREVEIEIERLPVPSVLLLVSPPSVPHLTPVASSSTYHSSARLDHGAGLRHSFGRWESCKRHKPLNASPLKPRHHRCIATDGKGTGTNRNIHTSEVKKNNNKIK